MIRLSSPKIVCVQDYHISWKSFLKILICDLDIHHISEPILLEQYVAISDYTKREESDISLKAGNVVEVIEKNEHGELVILMMVRSPDG